MRDKILLPAFLLVGSACLAEPWVTLPRDFGREGLRSARMLVALEPSSLGVPMFSPMRHVHPRVEDEAFKLEIEGPESEGSTGEVDRAFRAMVVGEEVRVDLEAPVDFMLGPVMYRGERPRKTRSVSFREKVLEFAQEFDLRARGELPPGLPRDLRITLHFQLYEAGESRFEPHAYPVDDRRRFGFITPAHLGDGSHEMGGPLVRWDTDRVVPVLLRGEWKAGLAEAASDAVEAWNDVLEPICGRRLFVVRPDRGAASSRELALPPPHAIVLQDVGDRRDAFLYLQANILVDPRSGEIQSGILPISSFFVERNVGFLNAGRRLRGETVEGTAAEYFRSLICHEMGHFLGLLHNFKGSRDERHFQVGELTSSVMDYLPHGYLTSEQPQPYDVAAMRYAYGDPGRAIEEFLFGGPLDARTDPDCNDGDLGEPHSFALSRWALLREGRGRLADLREDEAYTGQLAHALGPLVKMVSFPEDRRATQAGEFMLDVIDTRDDVEGDLERMAVLAAIALRRTPRPLGAGFRAELIGRLQHILEGAAGPESLAIEQAAEACLRSLD